MLLSSLERRGWPPCSGKTTLLALLAGLFFCGHAGSFGFGADSPAIARRERGQGVGGRIIGAAAGGIGGGVIGYKMDQQMKELEEQTAGTGVDVSETDGGEAILVNLPDGVTFSTGSYTISPGFRDLLDRVAGSLRQYPNSLIDVYGHTDTTGSATTNQRLSEQRAQAVANYLISQGVSSSRVRWMGFGETRLKVSTGDNVNEPLNRRVEIKIVPFDQRDIEAAQSQGM